MPASYVEVAVAERAVVTAPAGRCWPWCLLCLAVVSVLTLAVPSAGSRAAMSTANKTVAVAAGAGEPRIRCLFANRTFAVGAVIDAPPLASSCRPCTCTPAGEWQCCTLRPAAHSIARGTERYAETLAFVTAWMHLKLEGVPTGRTYRDNALMQWLMQHGLWFHQVHMAAAARHCMLLQPPMACGPSPLLHAARARVRQARYAPLLFQVHRTSWLLPWHRQYIYEVERLLLAAWEEIRHDEVCNPMRPRLQRCVILPVAPCIQPATLGVQPVTLRVCTPGATCQVRMAALGARPPRVWRAPHRRRRRDVLRRSAERDLCGRALLVPPTRRGPQAARRAYGPVRPSCLRCGRPAPRLQPRATEAAALCNCCTGQPPCATENAALRAGGCNPVHPPCSPAVSPCRRPVPQAVRAATAPTSASTGRSSAAVGTLWVTGASLSPSCPTARPTPATGAARGAVCGGRLTQRGRQLSSRRAACNSCCALATCPSRRGCSCTRSW